MKNIKYILLILFLSFILFCTRPPRESIHGTYDPKTLIWLPETYTFDKSKTFNSSFDELWSTIIDLLNDSDMLIESIDRGSGVITFQEWTTTDTIICDCGRFTLRIRTYRGWQRKPFEQISSPRTVNSTIYVRTIDSTKTEVKMVNAFLISYRSPKGLLDRPYKDWVTRMAESTYPDEWRCVSTGELESWFFQMIDMRLPSPKGAKP